MTEAQFRSARLHTWYNTPNEYYQSSLKELRAKAVDYNVEENFNKIQDNHALRGSLQLEKIRVYTEDHSELKTLTDSRFEVVGDYNQADVCWALGLDRSNIIKSVKENGLYINQFPDDEVLLFKDLLVALIHSTYISLGTESAPD